MEIGYIFMRLNIFWNRCKYKLKGFRCMWYLVDDMLNNIMSLNNFRLNYICLDKVV